MTEQIRKIIKTMPEENVKSLLYQINLLLEMTRESAYTESQFSKDIKKLFDMVQASHIQKQEQKLNRNAIHIVFGDSIKGALKVALTDMGLDTKEYVIAITDNFSIGPINKLDNADGIAYRKNWLQDHINLDDDYIDDYIHRFTDTIQQIMDIPSDTPIYLWTGENAHEQTALRFVLKIMAHRKNCIYIFNTTRAVDQLFNQSEVIIRYLHTGEIPPHRLQIIYESSVSDPITMRLREQLESEWDQLAEDQRMLRTWKNGAIFQVEEKFYDHFIMSAVHEIHLKYENHEFIKAARVIGKAIGEIEQYIGDSFLEYRLRELIFQGKLTIKGIPKAMRYYSVRDKEWGSENDGEK